VTGRLKTPLLGPFLAPQPGPKMLGPNERLDTRMRRYPHHQEVDVVVVGVGAAGGVLVQRLARFGLSVVGFDAGPFWDVERDWVSDEKGSHKLYWNTLRITGGPNPITLGANNSGKGVGGGTVHFAAFTPRFHPSDFMEHTLDGVGVDWPFRYETLKPYYAMIEREMPVAGPARYPWGDPHGYPYGPLESGEYANLLVRGCSRLGIRAVAGGPIAINSGAYGDRPHCIFRGFCLQGCKVAAKASTLYTHVPDGIANGAEIRDRCMVSRINLGKDGLVNGVTYLDPDLKEREQKAKVVLVCGYAIETPRLLLMSSCPGHENGLANSSGLVGRYLMVQSANVVMGRFPGLIRQYKAPPANACTEEFYETDHTRDFARGFSIQTVGPLPCTFAKEMLAAKGAWGWGMRKVMMDYNHWAAFGLLGEILPHEDNRIDLSDEKDEYSLPAPRIRFELHENDKKMIAWAVPRIEEIMRAAGAEETAQEPRYAHLIGGCRMGVDRQTSVTDQFGRTHDIPNLFCCDGSICPTQGAANPALTIQALAARTADYLIAQRDLVLQKKKAPLDEPPMRPDLSPPGTLTRGVPPRLNKRRR